MRWVVGGTPDLSLLLPLPPPPLFCGPALHCRTDAVAGVGGLGEGLLLACLCSTLGAQARSFVVALLWCCGPHVCVCIAVRPPAWPAAAPPASPPVPRIQTNQPDGLWAHASAPPPRAGAPTRVCLSDCDFPNSPIFPSSHLPNPTFRSSRSPPLYPPVHPFRLKGLRQTPNFFAP